MQQQVRSVLLFEPLKIRDLQLKNRIVISPMMQHAAPSGLATSWLLVHLGKFALGGAGLIFTESTAVSPVGRIGMNDLGLWDDEQIAPLKKVVDFVHEQGSAIGIQLGHAGRKAGSEPLWDGGGSFSLEAMAKVDPRWIRVGPSAISAGPGWTTPVEMNLPEIESVIQDFVAATKRAEEAGFDVVELHFGHGYLVTSFLSPLSNVRTDDYGGELAGRMKFAIKIATEVRKAWPLHKPLFCRISVVDGAVGGWSLEDSIVLTRELKLAGVDVIDCSSGGLTEQTRALPVPRGLGFQVSFAQAIRSQSNILTQAVGLIVDPQQAENILQEGYADLVAIGRAALEDPYWPLHAQEALCPDPEFTDWPYRHGVWLAKRKSILNSVSIQHQNKEVTS